jgi:hypothetical protein
MFFQKKDDQTIKDQNRETVVKILPQTDFSVGLQGVVKLWAANNIVVTAHIDEETGIRYSMGNINSSRKDRWQVPLKMQYYFKAQGLDQAHCEYLEQHFIEYYLSSLEAGFKQKTFNSIGQIVKDCFETIDAADYISKELMEEAKKKKRRRKS